MAFKVWLTSEEALNCGDDDMFDITDAAVLILRFAEPGRWSQYCPPGRWSHVAASPNHDPCEPLDRSIGPDFED